MQVIQSNQSTDVILLFFLVRLSFVSGDLPLCSLVFVPIVIRWLHMPASFVTEQCSPVLSRAQQAQRERCWREAEERLSRECANCVGTSSVSSSFFPQEDSPSFHPGQPFPPERPARESNHGQQRQLSTVGFHFLRKFFLSCSWPL